MSNDIINKAEPFNLDKDNWRTFKIMRKMATGYGKHGDLIDLRTYSNGSEWKNTNICIGVSLINISKNTNTIVSSYNKIDDNVFEILSYTDNFVYSSPVKDSYSFLKKNGDGANRTDTYVGNFFYLTFYASTISTKGGVSVTSSYRILKNGVWGESINVLNVYNDSYDSKSFILKFEEEVTIEVTTSIYTSYYTSASMSFSIAGGTKESGDLIYGEAEWLAYEN